MTPQEEREIIRKLRSGELTYTQENLSPTNVIRTPLPTTAPPQPPPPPPPSTNQD